MQYMWLPGMAAVTSLMGTSKRRSAAEEKRVIDLSRFFSSSTARHHGNLQQQHQQYQHEEEQRHGEDADELIKWTSYSWTLDELSRLYSNKLPVIVKATRGYYGQPGGIHLDVGQVNI